jgi:glyoxylase-like metal-dependent hydrolase (beta-lactamase superfamily II)
MSRSLWRSTAGALATLAGFATSTAAQASPYTDTLIGAVRRLAAAVPGDLPTSLHYLSIAGAHAPASLAVEGAAQDPVDFAFPVFQIRYRHGWIVVDAGMDREVAGSELTFHQVRYDQVQQALRQARLILVTHEHHDHVAGVIRSPYLEEVAARTLLTRAQVQTLLERPNSPAIKLDSVAAARYRTVDYDLLLPLAPGVVLIKAPGHTPGSQMVYIRLSSGREVILAGDVAWLMTGIQNRQQKPDSASRGLSEDRSMIQPELEWLNAIATTTGIVVLPCHDAAWLAGWRDRGVLKEGLDLRSP